MGIKENRSVSRCFAAYGVLVHKRKMQAQELVFGYYKCPSLHCYENNLFVIIDEECTFLDCVTDVGVVPVKQFFLG